MNDQNENMILVTNGHPATRPSLEFGSWLAGKLNLSIKLLAIQEPSDQDHPVAEMIERICQDMKIKGVSYQVVELIGTIEKLINEQIRGSCEMVVLGPLGRSFLYQVVHGHSIRKLMEDLSVPILYVPEYHLPVKKILVCLGGLGYAQDGLDRSVILARSLEASITIFHVVEPISLDYPLAKEVQDHWADLMTTDTPQGQNLRQALSKVQKLGLASEVKIRHGNIISEILKEVAAGDYELICMGSIFSSQGLRHFALPNITAEILETVKCPILTVRACLDD